MAHPVPPPPFCLFRVAAGPRLGFGHLMRARALAQGLGVRAAVSLHGGVAARRTARASGCALVDGARALKRAGVVVVDDPSPLRRSQWVERARRTGAIVVSVHDGGAPPDADLVVSSSLGVRPPRTRGRVLSGPRFYLLDRRVTDARKQRETLPGRLRTRPRVVVALGGGQHVRGLAQRLVDQVHGRCPGAAIVVAAGFSARPRPQLRHARWISARTDVWRALVECDVAIVAGGVTLYEACALGVPAVGLAVVPEQRPAIRAFAGRRALIDAGGGPCTDADLARAAEAVALLLKNTRLRVATAGCSLRLVDGRGSTRVAAEIRSLVSHKGSRAA